MFDLRPTKLLIILVVAVLLVGPTKLPNVARQAGAGWRKLKQVRADVEREVRSSVPDLPATRDLARYARSPMALLDKLAEMPSSADVALVPDPAAPAAEAGSATPDTGAGAAASPPGDGTPAAWPEDRAAPGPAAPIVRPTVEALRRAVPVYDDPGLN